jgi:hypothetical protein
MEQSSTRTTTTCASLHFEIDEVYWGEPLEGDESKILYQFANNRQVRDRLITPRGHVREFALPFSDLQNLQSQRQELLANSSKSFSSSAATVMDTTGLQFTTGAVHFPGLTIESNVQCGVAPCRDATLSADWVVPPYEFNVLETTNIARGSRPMIWLFNKLDKPTSRSLTLAGLARRDPNGPLRLRYHSRARVEFGFQTRLLKALPLSQQRTEALGSNALEKAVRAEVQACMEACRPLLLQP